MQIVQQKKGWSNNAKRFISALMQLRKLIMERFLTSPLELLQRMEYLRDVKKHIGQLGDAIGQMEAELAEAIRDRDEKVINCSGLSIQMKY